MNRIIPLVETREDMTGPGQVTATELRAELRKHGEDTTGRKAALVTRYLSALWPTVASAP